MSLISRLCAWVFPASPSRSGTAGGSSKRAELVRSQQELAGELERLFLAYDERMRGLSERLLGLTDEELEDESRRIADVQDEIRRVLRRVDASMKTRQQLERELAEWEDREGAENPHADHPTVRAEIARSELVARGVPVGRSFRTMPDVADEADNPFFASAGDERAPEISATIVVSAEPVATVDVGHLLAAIRDATREAERWHAVPASEHDDDALDQLHHVRDLHARLKRFDRERGIVRDRLELAVCPREIR